MTAAHAARHAVDDWRKAIGPEHVCVEDERLAAAATATFATTQRVSAVLRPANTAEVQECVRIAGRHRVPVYPVSRGRNWGLGSMVPTSPEAAVIDLSRMNHIVDFDETLAYLTVEPGVTFQQAHDFLRENNSNLFVAVTGGPPDGSLVGNALERGEGSGPYGDRAYHICGLEVVLPSGEVIHTGFRRFANADVAPLRESGVGPSLDGLFIQSNLGIITQLTVWLHPKPKFFDEFTCPVRDTADLAALLDAVRPLVLQGTIASHSFGFWNAYKLLAIRAGYPWTVMAEATPLNFRALHGRELWMASGALFTHSEQERIAVRAIVEEALAHLPQPPFFVTDEQRAQYPEPNSGLGEPTTANLRSAYWRKRGGAAYLFPAIDLDRDRCGVMWIHPTLPFIGEKVVKAAMLMESVVIECGFEPLIGMSCVSGRCINVYLCLMYDRDVPGEDQRAVACHDRVLRELIDAGFPPYRLGVQSMESIPHAEGAYEELLRTLKGAVDPHDILSPGRYDLRHLWTSDGAARA
ncbi:MAG: FAD/FMN-dependent dehydrogenase [Gemmatimonadetes bacterium]|nr:FAD/FMN-dependent dehydrogenase [Gemmatimonadota bacterium]